jgi:hypothetical protein
MLCFYLMENRFYLCDKDRLVLEKFHHACLDKKTKKQDKSYFSYRIGIKLFIKNKMLMDLCQIIIKEAAINAGKNR